MEHLHVVVYDIRSPKRWRKVFRLLEGYGAWLQLSVFQCRLSRMRLVQMEGELLPLLDQSKDHLMILDLGPMENVVLRVRSFGKVYVPIEKGPTIV